jgi:hypothetical protein
VYIFTDYTIHYIINPSDEMGFAPLTVRSRYDKDRPASHVSCP